MCTYTKIFEPQAVTPAELHHHQQPIESPSLVVQATPLYHPMAAAAAAAVAQSQTTPTAPLTLLRMHQRQQDYASRARDAQARWYV